VDECKPLLMGFRRHRPQSVRRCVYIDPVCFLPSFGSYLRYAYDDHLMGRGLHSSTFQLNVSSFCPMWWGALLVSVTKTAQVEQRCGRV